MYTKRAPLNRVLQFNILSKMLEKKTKNCPANKRRELEKIYRKMLERYKLLDEEQKDKHKQKGAEEKKQEAKIRYVQSKDRQAII